MIWIILAFIAGALSWIVVAFIVGMLSGYRVCIMVNSPVPRPSHTYDGNAGIPTG